MEDWCLETNLRAGWFFLRNRRRIIGLSLNCGVHWKIIIRVAHRLNCRLSLFHLQNVSFIIDINALILNIAKERERKQHTFVRFLKARFKTRVDNFRLHKPVPSSNESEFTIRFQHNPSASVPPWEKQRKGFRVLGVEGCRNLRLCHLFSPGCKYMLSIIRCWVNLVQYHFTCCLVYTFGSRGSYSAKWLSGSSKFWLPQLSCKLILEYKKKKRLKQIWPIDDQLCSHRVPVFLIAV